MDSVELEKYSSAITLSDMEVFVFPELMYALLLANIMSPVIWRWRQESSFSKLKGKSRYRKLMRLKQYIMDEYEFNLDLETWGLTDKDTELARFRSVLSPEEIAESNALFGYTGDKYYFDVDIRRHFGLDKYDNNIIPYWKTETVEAMNAFRLKTGYNTAAGECVSLAALYAAAAFVVCGIALEDIFMVLTPLHSQDFIDIQDGVLTNNRRIMTKAMWFNGTEISKKAQRALSNERVTIVAHSTGWIHCLYDRATIEADAYRRLLEKLGEFLTTAVDRLTLANFLRAYRDYQKYFQFCTETRGEKKFIKAGVLFAYEHGSTYRIADHTFDKLLAEVSSEDYLPGKYAELVCCEELESFMRYEGIDIRRAEDREKLIKRLHPLIPEARQLVDDLYDFTHIEPKTPSPDKQYRREAAVEISPKQTREQIIDYLESIRQSSSTADLAFYAYRDMSRCRWEPFVKAAVERQPVSVEAAKDMSLDEVYRWLERMGAESIYDGPRISQPDEVTNYQTGDGLEKAFVLADIIHAREPQKKIKVVAATDEVTVSAGETYRFGSEKGLNQEIHIEGDTITASGEQC